jgi:hypothetical protein
MLVLAACAEPAPPAGSSFDYPLDDTLTFADLQALGTHNSYHLEEDGVDQVAWEYSHLPLDEQAGEQGVRQFELDVNWIEDDRRFEVFHVLVVDQQTTCALLVDCLRDLREWSDDNPAHHPILTLLEMKAEFDEATAQAILTALEDEVLSVWPEDRLITPDEVQGDAASLAEAVALGWPPLGTMRGRALFVMHDVGDWRDVYTDGLTTSTGLWLFPDADGETDLPIGGVSTVNDVFEEAETLAAALEAGHLVRTRADADSAEAVANDTSRRDAALASGAHFVSTDWPAAAATGYVVDIPDGTPSRCNPVTAPPACTSEAIEDPAFME